MRVRAATSMVAIAVLLTTACTSASNGTLTGQVKMYGGPFNAATGHGILDGQPGPGWRVIVRSGSQEVATTTSDSSGHFAFTLAPGTYTLVCSGPQSVQVRSGQRTTVTCIGSVS
jgi:Carboxypeptidase regulatory-like domain